MANPTYKLLAVGLLLALGAVSCKKEESKIEPDPFYSYDIEGFTVKFDNLSKNATSYKWDFGDGSSSTDESPTHTYPRKGKYVPTLTAVGQNGQSADASTVLYISKGSSVKLDDHSLSDWDTIAYNVVIAGKNGGNFIKAKYDYDGNYVYIYFEQKAKQSDGDIYDMYIDADNNPLTGYTTGDIPGGGYEVLLEGTILGGWLDPYYHSGDQANFGGYAAQSLSEFYTVGDVEESNGVLRFEFGLKRSKIKGLTGQGMKIGVQVAANDWSATIGYSPDAQQPAFFLDMSE